jgi:hypothetical protein
VARALDAAARRWPGEPRSKLVLRLLHLGGAALEGERDDALRRRVDAITASSGKYAGVFSDDYLARLREDWSE